MCVGRLSKMGVTKMRNGTGRSAARDALQNVSDFVRYLLIIIILFSYNYVINIQIDILHLSEYF